MSLAGDIIKAAIEQGQKIASDHADSVNATAAQLTGQVGKPWKFRIGGMKEALESIAGEDTKPEESKDTE